MLLLGVTVFGSVTCSDPTDLCTPQEARLGFFSKGDCVFTRASYFQGHEWLTWFSNQSLPEHQRFSDHELQVIAEGNRRVDWPKELLIHMNGGIIQYVEALEEFTERPEHQRFHFLLTDTNTSEDAVLEASAELRRLTLAGAQHSTFSLTQVGRAHHLIQDAFSEAHARRDPDQGWCVVKVKAYIEREDGYDTPDIEYHGQEEGDEDKIGHTTVEDSIYRKGRDCVEPLTRGDVERCLSEPAKRAITASADYLLLIQELRRRRSNGSEGTLEAWVDELLPPLIARHLALCPP